MKAYFHIFYIFLFFAFSRSFLIQKPPLKKNSSTLHAHPLVRHITHPICIHPTKNYTKFFFSSLFHHHPHASTAATMIFLIEKLSSSHSTHSSLRYFFFVSFFKMYIFRNFPRLLAFIYAFAVVKHFFFFSSFSIWIGKNVGKNEKRTKEKENLEWEHFFFQMMMKKKIVHRS